MAFEFSSNVPRFCVLAACALCIPAAFAQQFALVDIQVTGASRLPAAAIISASGLAVGRTVTAKDFDAAVARLDETGLFTSLAYRYDPKTAGGKSGMALVLQITEAPVISAVRLDFPGVEEQRLWQEIKRENGLVDAQIPADQQAVEYYKNAIEAALARLNHAQDVVSKNEVDLTGKRALAFQSANLPKITSVVFEGNRLIDSKVLGATLDHVAFVGEDYSERFVRLLLEKNIQPLYEERGHLTVAFPRVGMLPQAAGVTVSVAIDEGPEWTLGKAELSGESIPAEEMHAAGKFPEGRLANWKQIQESIGAALAVLRRNGYLTASSQPARSYHEDNHVVDLAIKVNKGKQYLLGALEFSGLNPADEVLARRNWQLAQGAPVDPFYVDDYLRSLGKTIQGIKSFAPQYRPGAGTNVMDVVIRITMK